jgi:hypothetical protein
MLLLSARVRWPAAAQLVSALCASTAWDSDQEPTLCRTHSKSTISNLSAIFNNNCENFSLWPQFVKQRIQDTYMYFGASIGISAASAVAVFRTPALLNLVARSGWVSIIATFALVSQIVIIEVNYC